MPLFCILGGFYWGFDFSGVFWDFLWFSRISITEGQEIFQSSKDLNNVCIFFI